MYIDEFCTTKSTMPTHAWSLPTKPITIDYKQFSNSCIASVASISAKNGVDLIMNHPKSINQIKFSLFLRNLRRKYRNDKIALLCDRISFHRSLTTANLAEELGFKLVLNASYSPDFNAIEGAVGICK